MPSAQDIAAAQVFTAPAASVPQPAPTVKPPIVEKRARTTIHRVPRPVAVDAGAVSVPLGEGMAHSQRVPRPRPLPRTATTASTFLNLVASR